MCTKRSSASIDLAACGVLRHGMPAIVLTSAGLLPCVFAFLAERDEEVLKELILRFGGFVMMTHRKPDPCNRVVWIGYGRGAAVATRCVVSRPCAEYHKSDGRDKAWDSLATFLSLWFTPADSAGRRPPEVHEAMLTEARRLGPLVSAWAADYEDLVGVVESAVEDTIAEGRFAEELRAPYRCEMITGTVAWELGKVPPPEARRSWLIARDDPDEPQIDRAPEDTDREMLEGERSSLVSAIQLSAPLSVSSCESRIVLPTEPR